jgi:hypothetical protein
MSVDGTVTAADVQLMQGLAQRVAVGRPDLVNSDASFGELACLGAPGHPAARGLYYSVGFRAFSRDVPLIETVG